MPASRRNTLLPHVEPLLRSVRSACTLLLLPLLTQGLILAEGGAYSLPELLSRDEPTREVDNYPSPLEVLIPTLSDEGGGWTSGFSDRWHASDAFKGEFRQEFAAGLAWYLQAQGFTLGSGQDAVQVRVVFTGFEGRKRYHNDGGDLRGVVEVAYRRQIVARETLYETRTYRDESDQRKVFAASLGLQPVPFDTALFYRLSRGFFESVSRTLLDSRPEITQALVGTGAVNAPATSSEPNPKPREGKEIGFLSIQSLPDNAEIYIDGYLIATTPAPDVRLDAGEHSLIIRKEGYEEWSRTLLVLSDNRLVLRATLKPLRDE